MYCKLLNLLKILKTGRGQLKENPKNIRKISRLPLSWYHFSFLPSLKGHFKKKTF